MNTIGNILAEVRKNGFGDMLAAEVWLSLLMGESKTFLFAHPEKEVSEKMEQEFWQGIDQMREGKPLAQLTGSREFFGHDFLVNENVLIPRPESEHLVYLAIDYIRKNYHNSKVKVADIGTGSGCILLSVLKSSHEAQGIGVEVSAEAIKIAEENAKRLDVADRVVFRKGNLLEPLNERCEVILANLPYIGRKRFNFIAENVARFEPEVALYGGEDGLQLYREMFKQLNEKSWKPDFMAGEFGFGQSEEMEKILMENFSKYKYEIIPDLAGIPRVFVVNFA